MEKTKNILIDVMGAIGIVNIKYVLFDCMETLVDLTVLPALKDYAGWAFKGSGVEGYWKCFDEFFDEYIYARRLLETKYSGNKEYEMMERFRLIASGKFNDDTLTEKVSKKLYFRYWETYKSKCYIRDDVADMLQELGNSFRMGVVSNFMVKGGIEELLALLGLEKYFDFIITSINEGVRKPGHKIYESALEKWGILPEEVLFIGDDFVNDYETPRKIGMQAILLDRKNKYSEVEERIQSFEQLKIRFRKHI